VADAIEQADRGPAGERKHQFDYAELLTDTPELIDRTEGPLTDRGTETSHALADVLNTAVEHARDEADS
jgi:hypothetical protein